jgi:CubicO group peptidase (beta-lactamase class C family)
MQKTERRKSMKRLSICLLAMIAFVNSTTLFSAATAKANPYTTASAFEKTFDLELFEQNIRNALDNKCLGYAYAINLNGQLKKSGANGYAVLKRDLPQNAQVPDPKGVPQSASKRMNIASITKTITATTVLKVLQDKLVPDDKTLTIDSKVGKYLPAFWTRGPGINDLTFKELLSQLSGMNDNKGKTDIASLKSWIAAGVTRPKDDYIYINANLAIFRIILPMMLATPAQRAQFSNLASTNQSAFDQAISNLYKLHVNTLVLVPMGIANADCNVPNEPYPTRLYHYPDQGFASTNTGDWTLTCGGGGWYLSAIDLARFLAHLRYNDNILTPVTRRQMDAFHMGWRFNITGAQGEYYAHGGGLGYKPNVNQPNDADPEDTLVNPVGDNGMTGCIMNYPNGVQVSLLINSTGSFGSKYSLLTHAYDNAWVLNKKINP